MFFMYRDQIIYFCLLPSPACLAYRHGADETNLEAAPSSHESIEWCDIWISHADETNLPRVLLIGDSITRAYYPGSRKTPGRQGLCGEGLSASALHLGPRACPADHHGVESVQV